MMAEYCDCGASLPDAAADLLAKLIEVLKMFNSRTCQLILGAGALQLLGLKTITVKNLGEQRCVCMEDIRMQRWRRAVFN